MMTGTSHHSSTKTFLAILLLALCTGCSGVDNAPSSMFANGAPPHSKKSWTDTLKHPIESTRETTAALNESLKSTAQSFLGDGQKRSIPTAKLARKSSKERKKQGQNLSIAVARTLEKQGNVQQATKAYQQAIDSGARDAVAYHRLAVLYDKGGKFKKANPMYRKAIALTPNDPKLLADQGYSFYLQSRYAEAEEFLNRALELDNDLPRARNNLAMVLARREKFDDSFAEFRRAGSDITDAHVNLAYVMMWKGDLQGAHEEFELALAIDESCVEAKQGLERMRSLAGGKDDARQASSLQASNPFQTSNAAPPRQPAVNVPVRPTVEESIAKMVQYTSEWPRRAAY